MLSNFIKASNIKDIAIILLTAFSIFLFINIIYTSNSNRKQIKELKKENKEMQNQRDIIKIKINELKKEELVYISNIKKISSKVDSLSLIIKTKDSEIEASKIKIKKSQKEIEKTKIEINKLKSNPIERKGNELLNSIKDKTIK
jgi:cell division protein FtsB